jgi:hypothetical protein
VIENRADIITKLRYGWGLAESDCASAMKQALSGMGFTGCGGGEAGSGGGRDCRNAAALTSPCLGRALPVQAQDDQRCTKATASESAPDAIVTRPVNGVRASRMRKIAAAAAVALSNSAATAVAWRGVNRP